MISHSTKLGVFLFIFYLWLPASGQEIKLKLKESGVSQRDLLGLGPLSERLASSVVRSIYTNTDVDTLRILAIRVDFQEDNNTLTTGNGKFDFSVSVEGLIDPAPHDRSYFEDQLTALSNYFKRVSRGKLILESDVYPEASQSTYTVSQEMSFYSPVESDDLLDDRLSLLFQEGFQLADASGQIDFSQYDSFILFHAGVGSDFAFDFDPTPQDIPSVFLDLSILRQRLGGGDPAYSGIPVNSGGFFIPDGIVLAETQSQEGFEIALLGTIALQFGHQIGLPNLFDTNTGRPGIGIFGLMDQGSGNFTGLLPAEPCAWSKVFLGWETPIEVRRGQDLPIAASQASDPNKIYKIPINSQEYFLVENRDRDVAGDNVAIGRDAKGTRVEFRWDDQGQRLLAEEAIGVITEVSEYDFGLPGSGILIWHIDERVIAANFEENLVNGDPELRGVDLEEADGAQDLGQVYGFLSPGAGAENGVIEDMFWGSNPINMLVNDSSSVVEFTPTTTPSSLSNSGANSHVFITDFSEPAEVMTFSVREDISQLGFPQVVGASDHLTNSPIMADLNSDGSLEIIWSSNRNTQVLVWNSDGAKLIENDDSMEIPQSNVSSKMLPLAIFAEPPGTVAFSPAVGRLDDQEQVVIVATDEVVAAYRPTDADGDGRADPLFELSLGNITTPPSVIHLGDFHVLVGTGSGTIMIVDRAGVGAVFADIGSGPVAGLATFPTNAVAFSTETGTIGLVESGGTISWRNSLNAIFSTAPVVADLNRDGALDIVCVTDQGQMHAFHQDGTTLTGFPQDLGIVNPSQLAVGDVDGDGFFEVALVAESSLHLFNHVGKQSNNFPILASEIAGETSPILADLDNNGFPEVIAGSFANRLVGFDLAAETVAGLPLSTGGAINSTPAAGDIDGDGDLELAAVSDDGFLYVWDLPSGFVESNVPWGSFLRDAGHSNANPEIRNAPPQQGRLMPANLVYNYPNPTEGNRTTIRYLLNSSANVRIKIYDLAGDLVDEFSGPGFGQVENEVDWQLDDIQSGVYLARVEATNEADRAVAIFKIAVVK